MNNLTVTNCHRMSSNVTKVVLLNGPTTAEQRRQWEILRGVVNLGIVCALHLSVCRCIPETYPGVLQAAGKERAISRPPADNNQHYTQTVTTTGQWSVSPHHDWFNARTLKHFNTAPLFRPRWLVGTMLWDKSSTVFLSLSVTNKDDLLIGIC